MRHPDATRALALAVLVLSFNARIARAHEPGEEEAHPIRTAPVLVERAEPVYPEVAREQGIGGTVSLEITVAADGPVAAVKVARPGGFGFDEAAVAAARRFRFKPATESGKPIAAVVLFDQGFVLRPRLRAEVAAEPQPTEVPAVPA